MSTNQTHDPTTSPAVGHFLTTQWTRVLEAAHLNSPTGQDAFAQLYLDYRYPLYAYVRRRSYGPVEAEDVIQTFFERLIRNQGLEGIQREGGRFRSFLLAALARLLASEWNKARAQKRGDGAPILSLDAHATETRFLAEPAAATPELGFDREWALTLLQRVSNELRNEYDGDGKGTLFDLLRPCLLSDTPSRLYEQLSVELGMTEGAVKVAVHRLRHRYGQRIRQEIGRTVSSPEEISEELRHLMRVVAR